MDEQRLIEITSEVVRLDGPLMKTAYIASLNEDDVSLLCRNLNNPKYEKLSLYEKILKFSQDYLESQNISLIDILGKDLDENDNEHISYIDQLLLNDSETQVTHNNNSRR